jgi:pyruvate dehydrogenase E1 component alpha subunit
MKASRTALDRSPGLANEPPLLALYRELLLIRRTEERLAKLFADGEIPGFIHLSIGQEAISVGVMRHLAASDTIASTHRGHGHALAKGMSLRGSFCELMGRDEGLCRGRGGSMHVADSAIGMLGANGIVGAGLPIALGSALSHKTLGRDAIAVAFFGDAAMAEGVLHECLNLARLQALPLLFVCENNGWGEFLPTAKQVCFRLERLCDAFGIPYRQTDGNDVALVSSAAESLVPRLRNGEGPAVLECMTTRVRGHFEGDPQKYRDRAEAAETAARDPLTLTFRQLLDLGVAGKALEKIAREIEDEIDSAVAAARGAREPDLDAASRDVYTPGAAS